MPDITHFLGELTIEEKAALCSGADFWHTVSVPRLGIRAIMMSDGPHGLRMQAVDGSRPESVAASRQPVPDRRRARIVVGPGVGRGMGSAIGEEALAQGMSLLLGPGVNIKRSLLCGRNFEYFAEDPVLAGPRRRPGSTACSPTGWAPRRSTTRSTTRRPTGCGSARTSTSGRCARSTWPASSSGPPRPAVDGDVRLQQSQRDNASQHRWLLTELLRGEWGFAGLVVSDWGAVHDRVAAVAAGLDLEMPPDLGVTDARSSLR